MHEHHLTDMASLLIAAGVITPSITVEDVTDILKTYFENKIGITWAIGDVKHCTDKPLTDDDCREILSNIMRHHDAEVGINWEVIRCHIDMFLEDKNK